MKSWQIQEAKQHFSRVVKMARQNGPQEITFRGEETAWLLSAEDYRKLRKTKGSLVEFFQGSPHRNVDLKLERRQDLPREIEL